MKKRKIIAKLMVLSMIISNVSGISVQATDNIDVQNDNSIQYNVDTENSETFEESNVDKNIIFNETVENDDLISNENEILKEMEEVEKIDEQSLDSEINEEVNYDESEVISEEVTIISPMVSRAAAIGNVNILSSDSTTVAQAEAWARAKGATEEFIGLASLYQKYAGSRGGVNWALAYVQAAKETGYGRFGGVLDASYKNPCGLKESSGGGDYDQNAHKRFDTWDQGIIAHLDHLALYAGASGYPKTNYISSWKGSNIDNSSTYDPRHFTYLKGTATTAIDLGGKWAPSSTYGLELLRLYCDLTGADYLPSRSNLDYPETNKVIKDGKLYVKGWAVTAFGVKQINVLVDNTLIGTTNVGVSRPDVQQVYPNYYNSANSGFETTFDISSLSNGVKTLSVQIVSNDGSIQTINRSITINKTELIFSSCLDTPTENETVKDTLNIKGWSLSAAGTKEVAVYIDGTKVGTVETGKSRNDVDRVYPGYPEGATSGFEGKIDLSRLSSGTKTLTVKITSKDGTVQEISRKIVLQALDFRSCLDYPSTNTTEKSDTMYVQGWALHASGIKSAEVFIDNKSYGNVQVGVAREDVAKVYPKYPNGIASGYAGNIDISKLSDGNKTVKVVITANDGTTQTITRNITVKKLNLASRSCLDTPTENEIVKDSLTIKGWALSVAGTKEVAVYIDGTKVGTVEAGKSRPDVNRVYPGYPEGATSGFEGKIDVSKLSSGTKTLTVKIIAKDGTVQEISRKIVLQALDFRTCLDYPAASTTVKSDVVYVQGWALHATGIKSAEVFIDNKSYGNVQVGILREDVAKVYPKYPNGASSGFQGDINIAGVSDGNKTVKVIITANDGTTQTITRNITVKRLNLVSRSCLDTPTVNESVSNTLNIKGWALSSSGTKTVEVLIDGTKVGTVKAGKSRPDVDRVYPGYPEGTTSGFEGSIDISSLSAGKKSLTVRIIAKDGTIQEITRSIQVVKLETKVCLDYPVVNQVVTSSKIDIKGWILNTNGVKEIKAYIDGTFIGNVITGLSRPDVAQVYPEYNNSNSGFEAHLLIDNLSAGNKTLTLEIEDNKGNIQKITRSFTYKPTKTIYIDPGHDYGGDMGAVRVINGVTYDETTLNIEVAEYLRTELINKGYEVIMARRIGERPTSSNYRENLWNRINAANNANADFYISIHQNASTTASANGVEAYYSSVKPDSLNDITYKLNTSKAVAASISSGIASALSMTNRGTKDDEFMVVKYTNMPAVLVECGFISNESDAKKISNATNQKKIASVIADSIHNALK